MICVPRAFLVRVDIYSRTQNKNLFRPRKLVKASVVFHKLFFTRSGHSIHWVIIIIILYTSYLAHVEYSDHFYFYRQDYYTCEFFPGFGTQLKKKLEKVKKKNAKTWKNALLQHIYYCNEKNKQNIQVQMFGLNHTSAGTVELNKVRI